MHQAIIREGDISVPRIIVIVAQAWRSKRSLAFGVRINERQKERRECGGEFCYLQMGNLGGTARGDENTSAVDAKVNDAHS